MASGRFVDEPPDKSQTFSGPFNQNVPILLQKIHHFFLVPHQVILEHSAMHANLACKLGWAEMLKKEKIHPPISRIWKISTFPVILIGLRDHFV